MRVTGFHWADFSVFCTIGWDFAVDIHTYAGTSPRKACGRELLMCVDGTDLRGKQQSVKFHVLI